MTPSYAFLSVKIKNNDVIMKSEMQPKATENPFQAIGMLVALHGLLASMLANAENDFASAGIMSRAEFRRKIAALSADCLKNMSLTRI